MKLQFVIRADKLRHDDVILCEDGWKKVRELDDERGWGTAPQVQIVFYDGERVDVASRDRLIVLREA